MVCCIFVYYKFFSNKDHWVTTFLLITSIIVFATNRLNYHHERIERERSLKEQIPKKIEEIHKEIYELKELLSKN